jgi:SWI/SNF chromatin-remodeling complex subunit SWI1
MPAWLSDLPAASNIDNGTFNPSVDPSVAFLQTPTAANFDFNQLQNPQLQQRMQNGIMRNGSPAFQNPAYQPQSVIPAKRPRGGSDVYGSSPRPAAGVLPNSRSQTPQQAQYMGFQGNVNGAHQMQAPTPYQHLQHGGSSNASPSPVMHDQHFNPQAMSQRMQTVSPSPFSPAAPNYGSQGSPPHSDYGSRVDTPQNGGQPYMQGMSYGGPSPQHFTPPPGHPSNGMQGGPMRYTQNPQAMQMQQQQQQQRIQEMRQQQLLARQLQATNEEALRHQGGMMTPSPAQIAQYQQVRAQQMQQAMLRPQNPESFLRQLTGFMHQRGLPFNSNPVFNGRPIHPGQIWTLGMKLGGSKKVTAGNLWPQIAGLLQLQYPSASEEVQSYWMSNLYPWEQILVQSIQQSQQQRHRPMPNQVPMPQHFAGDNVGMGQDQFSPVKQLHTQNQNQTAMMQARRQSAEQFQTPTKSIMPQQQNMRPTHMNGFTAPPQSHVQAQNAFAIQQAALQAQSQPPHPRVQQPPVAPPGPNNIKTEPLGGPAKQIDIEIDALKNFPKQPIGEEFVPMVEDMTSPSSHSRGKHRPKETYGGYDLAILEQIGDAMREIKPLVPSIYELGTVDIRALTMSIRSGIHAEVRVALDTLATISAAPEQLRAPSLLLEDCEDLVEVLVDCAEEQVELLAENAAEVSDDMLISPYEDLVRGCRSEIVSLVDVPEFGTLEYDLDRAAERLICITTLFRNFSEAKQNHHLLADAMVVRLITTVIRYLGTRNMLLRTHRNTLDFSKDIITFLSNVSQVIDLPGKEEALCILHFLLSFAPQPPPTTPDSDAIMFSSYHPSTHRYLPAAVDSLAKILARDDPNRTFYKSILTADSDSNPPLDLLTRTFALAIAPIPNYNTIFSHPQAYTTVLETRKPFIAQGMLAADILVTLMPSSEHVLARSWLTSQDGFALSLLRLVSQRILEGQPVRQVVGPNRQVIDEHAQDWAIITSRAINVLRKLAERTKDSRGEEGRTFSVPLPKQEILVRALRTTTADRTVLRQLCAYAGLAN